MEIQSYASQFVQLEHSLENQALNMDDLISKNVFKFIK